MNKIENRENGENRGIRESLKKKISTRIIPRNLLNYAKHQCKRWAQNMVSAKFVTLEDAGFLIDQVGNRSKAIYVDADNTGRAIANMQYGDGLHQFIQLEKGLKMTSENLVTCFSTNTSYLRRWVFALDIEKV